MGNHQNLNGHSRTPKPVDPPTWRTDNLSQQHPRLHIALLAWSLIQSHSDPNFYFAHICIDTIALIVYVDDIFVTCNNPYLIT